MNGLLASINFNSILLSLISVLGGGIFVALIKRQPALKKIANEREADLLSERAEEMKEMRERISRLEQTIERERQQRETDKEALKAKHEAERSLDRHKIKNLQQCFDALIMMLKASPEKVEFVVEHIEKLRAEQMKAEAIESGAYHAAKVKDSAP